MAHVGMVPGMDPGRRPAGRGLPPSTHVFGRTCWPPTEAVPPVYARPQKTTAQPAVPRALQVVSAPPAPRRLELPGVRDGQSDLQRAPAGFLTPVPLAHIRNPGSRQAPPHPRWSRRHPLAHSMRLPLGDPPPPFLSRLAPHLSQAPPCSPFHAPPPSSAEPSASPCLTASVRPCPPPPQSRVPHPQTPTSPTSHVSAPRLL